MDALSLTALRMELAAAIMLPIFFGKDRRLPARARDIWAFVYLAFFGIVINQGCFMFGLNYTTSQHSVIIIALGPIIVLLLAVAMRLEHLTPAKILGMGISIFGVIALETERGGPAHSPLLFGDIVTLIGAIGYSIYAVLGKRVVSYYDAFTLSAGTIAAAGVIMLPLAIRQSMRLDWAGVGWAGWAGMAFMAIFSSVVAYTVFYWVLRYMEASRVSAIYYFQPPLVIVLASMILGERLSDHLLMGAALVLLGVYIIERNVDLLYFARWRRPA